MKALLLLSLCSLPALAAPKTVKPLFSMSNDRDANVDKYEVELGADGNVTGFAVSPAGKPAQSFSLASVARPDGAVLINSQGYDVLFLQGALKKGTQEGIFHLKYLSNGLSRSYTTCDFELKKKGDAYFAQSTSGQVITKAKMTSWSLGIASLVGICK